MHQKQIEIRNLSDEKLLHRTVGLVRQERELLIDVLNHLKEIDRRRLFADPSLKYESLFDFAVRHLKYPEDQAQRRISAMRLLRDLPQIEDKINQGALTLTHLNLAQTVFRKEKKIQNEFSVSQKIHVLEQMSGKPVREAEQVAMSFSSNPVSVKPDRVATVSAECIELKFIASAVLAQKVKRLKGLLGHRHPEISLGELFEKLCDLGIQEWDPSRIRKTAAPRKTRNAIESAAQIRRDVFAGAKNRCENCGSWYCLEVDHIRPRAFGGSSGAKNLRLLCRPCNQRAAINALGLEKMNGYLSRQLGRSSKSTRHTG